MFNEKIALFNTKTIDRHRHNLAVHLFNHAMKKQLSGYISDPEIGKRRRKKVIQEKNLLVYRKRLKNG